MTVIWGIVNVTPDSFSDGGRFIDADAAIAHGLSLWRDGAAVLDIGGESTRPGSSRITAEEEQRRILDVVSALASEGIPVSVDTLNASTAVASVAAGARIVNDVSGGLADPDMLAAVAVTGADYALGHWRGPSDDMYARADYLRPSREVAAELQERVGVAAAAGIAPARLILDPGIGFAKAGSQNWDVLRGIEDIVGLGSRVLVGTSRKGFLRQTLVAASDSRDSAASPGDVAHTPDLRRQDLATAVTSALLARAGIWAVRVHDVAATRDALAVVQAWDG